MARPMLGHRELSEYGEVVAGPGVVDGLIEDSPALCDIESGAADAATDEDVVNSTAQFQ